MPEADAIGDGDDERDSGDVMADQPTSRPADRDGRRRAADRNQGRAQCQRPAAAAGRAGCSGHDPHMGQPRIVRRDRAPTKQVMPYRLTNMGQPFIYVVDRRYANRGGLFLARKHNGPDVEIKNAVDTLRNLRKVWGRPVYLYRTLMTTT